MKKKSKKGDAVIRPVGSGGGSGARRKPVWAGIGPGDAFKPDLDYHLRLAAQRMFYRAAREVQEEAARHAGVFTGRGFKPNVLPQLGACYSGYPASLAARAAMGLTAYLEFESHAKSGVFGPDLVDAVKGALFPDSKPRSSAALVKIVEIVRDNVQRRLFLEDMASSGALACVETYRLFAAAHQSMNLETMSDLVRIVVLYGDILPPWDGMTLHPLSRTILEKLSEESRPYFERLVGSSAEPYDELGRDWIVALCRCLVPYVPSEILSRSTRKDLVQSLTRKLNGAPPSPGNGEMRIPPLDSPRHPSLFRSPDFADGLIEGYLDALSAQDRKLEAAKKSVGIKNGAESLKEKLCAFEDVLRRAWKQKNEWEDVRSDILVRQLMVSAFMRGPIQGEPVFGHLVNVNLGDRETHAGSVFDKPVACSEDPKRCEKLLADAKTATRVMKELMYPNREMRPVVERIRTRGSLDPARLAVSDFSPAIFKINRLRETLDKRGSPVVAIACDGSGSLNAGQMRTLKILTTSWLESTARTDVRVLAGLYTSDHVKNGIVSPVVKWIYHPHKTPAVSRRDAVRAVAALPESGRGVQADALSIAFIVEEAKRLARGKMIYLVLLTDCAWNRSFDGGKSGHDEVRSLFEALYGDLRERLHVTLVGLGLSEETGMEDLLDKVIAISENELADSGAVAEKIGAYVASCVRERNRG